MKIYKEWTELDHPIFGDTGREPAAKTEALLGTTGMFPRKQWRKGIFSIIPPCEITDNLWELRPVEGDVERFATLEEAKAKADSL